MNTKQFICIITALTLILSSCAKKQTETTKNEQVIAVQVASIKETATVSSVYCSGVLASKRISKLSFKTGGIISHLYVDEGSTVRKGQILASLDLTEISAQVQQTRVSFEKAERDYNRAKNLYADTVITLEQLQNATSAYEAALETKNIAEFNQRYSQIVAPANGIIISKLAEENELAGPGLPVLVFSEQGANEWIVKAGVSDKDVVALKKGDKAMVSFDAFQSREFAGVVTHLSELADPASGTFEVEVTVNPENVKFINGLVASARINSSSVRTVSLLPPDAVTEANGHKGFVYVLAPNKTTAHKVPVTISHIQNSLIAVFEPLNQLGMVVTKGAAYLEDGSRVSVK
jgi:RND family efflux transporter MFP subunit